MLTVQFWATFVLASLGLGSVVFILLAVLPPFLRRARPAVEVDYQEFKARVAEAESSDLKEVAAHSERLQASKLDLRTVLWSGVISAAAFLLTGVIGLGILTVRPVIDDGIEVIPVISGLETLEGILFGSGFLVFLLFLLSFLRIVQLYLKYDEAKEALERGKFKFR